jgi:hypothetical protein
VRTRRTQTETPQMLELVIHSSTRDFHLHPRQNQIKMLTMLPLGVGVDDKPQTACRKPRHSERS